MYIPQGYSYFECMAPLRRDMTKLADEGNLSNTDERFFAFPSLLPADLPQQYENCRHLGNSATLNCRSCLVHKDLRMDVNYDVLDFHNIRRKEQTDIIVAQLRAEVAATDLKESGQKKLRSKYGVMMRDCLFYGLNIDTHNQAISDPDTRSCLSAQCLS